MDYEQALKEALEAVNAQAAQQQMAANIEAGNAAYGKLAEEADVRRSIERQRLAKRMAEMGIAGPQPLTARNNSMMAGYSDIGDISRQNQRYTGMQNAMKEQADLSAAAQVAKITADMNAAEDASDLEDTNNRFERYYRMYMAKKMTRSQFKKKTGIDVRGWAVRRTKKTTPADKEREEHIRHIGAPYPGAPVNDRFFTLSAKVNYDKNKEIIKQGKASGFIDAKTDEGSLSPEQAWHMAQDVMKKANEAKEHYRNRSMPYPGAPSLGIYGKPPELRMPYPGAPSLGIYEKPHDFGVPYPGAPGNGAFERPHEFGVPYAGAPSNGVFVDRFRQGEDYGRQVSKDYNVTITDEDAANIGFFDFYISDMAKNSAAKQAAEKYAQQAYGTDYKHIPVTFYAGPLGLPVTTYLDASTGLLENQSTLGIDNANIKDINNAASTLMLQKSLGYTDDQLDQNSITIIKDKGLTQIIDIINDREKGGYFEVTPEAKASIEKGMALQAGLGRTINEGLSKAKSAETEVRERSDYEDVIKAPPPLEWNDALGWLGVKSGVKTEWNYIFDPTPEQFYATVITAYNVLHAATVNPGAKPQMDAALADGTITRQQFDQWAQSVQDSKDQIEKEQVKWKDFNFLTQDMVDTITYLYAEYKKTGDNTKLTEYYNAIRPLMRDAQYTAFKGGMQDIVNKYGAAGTALTGLVSAGDYFLSGGAYMYNAYNAANGLPTDPTAGVLQIARASQDLPDIAVSNITDPTAKWLTKTMITMAPQLGAYIVNPSLGLFTSASATAGRDVTQQIRAGATPWDATVHATVMAGIDYLANKAMLRGFSAVMQGNMFNLPSGFLGNLAKYATNALKAFGVGALVTAQKVAMENIADMALAGSRSRYTALVSEHLEEGMPLSKAQAAAAFESLVKQPLGSSIEGGLMAAAFSAYGTYKNNANLKANQALDVTDAGKAGYDPYSKTDFGPLDEAALREIGAGQRLLTEGLAQPKISGETQGLPGMGGSSSPGTPGMLGLPGGQGAYNTPGSYGAAAALKAAGLDLQGKSGYNKGQTSGDNSYINYLRIMGEMDVANKAGMTAREFAESLGVPSTFTNENATISDKYDVRLQSEGEGQFTSPDKYVGETANSIEAEFPDRVVSVNKKVYKPDGSTLTDLDIELDNIVIQVKSGSGKKLTSQMKRTQAGTGKIVIGYAPDLNPSSALIKGAKAAGFEVFTSWDELLAYLRTH